MKPIIFNTEMVKSILEGRKVQTRRPIKIKNKLTRDWALNTGVDWIKVDLKDEKYPYSIREQNGAWNEYSLKDFINKYSQYKVGDVLYVRERFQTGENIREKQNIPLNQDIEVLYYVNEINSQNSNCRDFAEIIKWKPSIHMPKEYARIFLKVTNVRVERLHDISDRDILMEGCNQAIIEKKSNKTEYIFFSEQIKNWWINLWNSTAKDGYKWENNPYVFAYEFKRVEK